MAGKKRGQVASDPNGSDSRSTAAMGYAKSLMQVQVANIGPDKSRASKSTLGMHVRSVHVDLRAIVVDDLANILYRRFKYAMRGRVGDHQRGQRLLVLLA